VPLGTHNLLARGKLDNFPSSISPVSIKFLQTGLLPLARLRKLLGVSEASGFSDGGQVGIGSGVEGVIRVIRVGTILLFIILWRVLSRRITLIIII